MSIARNISGILGFRFTPEAPEKSVGNDNGERGRIRATLLQNPAVGGEAAIADRLLSSGEVVRFRKGDKIIEQGAFGDEVYFLLFGDTDIIADGSKLTMRSAPNQVGEMSAIEPGQPRSATVQVRSKSAKAWRIGGSDFRGIRGAFPRFTERLQIEMSSRHRERIVAGQIARENNSLSWFWLSLAAAFFVGLMVFFGLYFAGWTIPARSVFATLGAIFIFLLMLMHNPVFFWRRSFKVALLGMIGVIVLDRFVVFEIVHGFGNLQVEVLPDGVSADWKTTASRVLPFVAVMVICAMKDRKGQPNDA